MKQFDQGTDEPELLKGIKNNRIEAFEEIFRRYVKRFYFFCFGILKDEALASETVTNIFKRIWDERKTVPDVTLEMYIFRMACQEVCLVLKEDKSGIEKSTEKTAGTFFSRLLTRFFTTRKSASQLPELKECSN